MARTGAHPRWPGRPGASPCPGRERVRAQPAVHRATRPAGAPSRRAWAAGTSSATTPDPIRRAGPGTGPNAISRSTPPSLSLHAHSGGRDDGPASLVRDADRAWRLRWRSPVQVRALGGSPTVSPRPPNGRAGGLLSRPGAANRTSVQAPIRPPCSRRRQWSTPQWTAWSPQGEPRSPACPCTAGRPEPDGWPPVSCSGPECCPG
ncbi:MAG: hypothetical protein QOD57_2463 [Actinomycetota bacterium]|nr:hypothetical protein [Actinomycetota bacterium]